MIFRTHSPSIPSLANAMLPKNRYLPIRIGLYRLWSLVAIFVLLANISTGVLLAAVPELQVTVTDTRVTAVPTELLTYTVQVNNNSALALSDVRIRIQLSQQVTYVTASDGPNDFGGGLFEWTIPSMPKNSVAFRYLSVTVNSPLAPGTLITTSTEVDQVNDTEANTSSDSTTVEAPAVTFSPTNLDFGDQRVGIESQPKTVTLTNSGNQPLTISSIDATTGFKVTDSDCPVGVSSLAAGASCAIKVSFTPTGAGVASGTLSLTDSAAGNPTVALSGKGIEPKVDFSSNPLSFTARVGFDDVETVTLTNSGTAPLTITSISANGPFTVSSACPSGTTTLNAGADCTISITFTPTAAGPASGTLTVTDDAPGSPHTVVLNGTGTEPAISLVPSTLTFGPQDVGTQSISQSVTLTNNGSAALTIRSITASNSEFAVTHNCPTIVAASDTCTISVTFTPADLASREGKILIDSDAPTPAAIDLSGTGLAATVKISPATIDFGEVQVTATSAVKTVTITNTGNTGLQFTSIDVSGDFSKGNTTCPVGSGSLALNTSCTVEVTFTPSTFGTRTGTLTFNTNTPGGPQTVGLSGVGLQAILNVSPGSLSFGDQRINTTSGPQTVTLTNNGNQSLTINSFAVPLSSPFGLLNTTCTSSSGVLAANGSCTIDVEFSPTTPGPQSATLTINDTAPGNPHSVSLTGNGTDPQAKVDKSILDFGSQQVSTTSGPQQVTLTNDGNGDLKITDISADGNFSQTNNCGVSLAAGTSCTINVTFRPTAIGARTGTLTITDDAANSPQNINLTGIGIQPVLTLEPTILDFGDQAINSSSATKVITVTNTGSQPLVLNSITASGDFAQTSTCSTTTSLAIGASCTISVVFTPTKVGAISGGLTITSNAPSSPHTLALSGTGMGPVFQSVPAPGPLAMSSLLKSSNAITISISNGGNMPLVTNGPAETVNAPFSIISDSQSSLQASNGDRVIVVQCAPTSVGPFTQQLTFTTNDPDVPTATYSLTCTGTVNPTPGYSSSPLPNSTWQIGSAQVGGSAVSDLFISESGTAALIVGLNGGSIATALTGPNASDFSVTAPPNFPITIPDNSAPQRLIVRCVPTGAGTRTAILTLTTNDPSQPTVSYTLSCTGQAITTQHVIRLPIVTKVEALVADAGQPDLVVSLNVSATRIAAGAPMGISVTVTNQGDAVASEFWVDLYINPNEPPTASNQPWNKRCGIEPCYGIAWYVTQQVEPGQSIILTSEPNSYYADNTVWQGAFAAGTSDLYAYVDSWNPTVANGAVAESNENNNRAELHDLVVSGASSASQVTRSVNELPPRPERPSH